MRKIFKSAFSKKVLVFGIVIAFLIPGVAGWWNSAWLYRAPITIAEVSGNNLTDYQIGLIVNTATLIVAGKMRGDCGDIRFANNGTSLNYWLESGCNTASTVLWVKVPSIPASSIVTIYMYYGNPAATSTSSGDSTFEFFDDASTDKSASYIFTDVFGAGETGSLTYDGTNDYYTVTHTATDEEFLRIASLGTRTNLWLRGQFWIQTSGGGGNNQFGFIGRQTAINTYYRFRQLDDFNRIEFSKEVGGAYTLIGQAAHSPALQTWYTLEGSIFGYTGTTRIFSSSGTLLASTTATDSGSSIASGNFGVQTAYDAGTVIRFRNIIVRKYTSPEPMVTLGAEQLATTSIKKNVPNLNQSIGPLASTNIAKADSLLTQAQSLLLDAKAKNLDTAACEKTLDEARLFFELAKKYKNSPSTSNYFALKSLAKLNQAIDCLKALLG